MLGANQGRPGGDAGSGGTKREFSEFQQSAPGDQPQVKVGGEEWPRNNSQFLTEQQGMVMPEHKTEKRGGREASLAKEVGKMDQAVHMMGF